MTDDDKHYTKEDMEKAVKQTREGTEPPTSRKSYSEEDLRAEIIKAATLAAQVAQRNQQAFSDAIVPPHSDGGLLVTMPQLQVAVKSAIGEALTQLFDDLGLPIGTREEKRQTVLKLEEMMKLNTTSRKIVIAILTTVGGILGTVAGGFGIYLLTHGAMR